MVEDETAVGRRLLQGFGGLLDHVGVLISIGVTFVAASTDYLKANGDRPIENLAWGFTVCLVILSIYFFAQYFLIRGLSKRDREHVIQVADVRRGSEETKTALAAAKEEISAERSAGRALSEAMIDVSRLRGSFDDALFEQPYLGKPVKADEIRAALTIFLNGLSDAAVRAMAATKGGTDRDFQANIKFMFEDDDQAILHKAYGRSFHSNKDRIARDKSRAPYLVASNKCMVSALRREGRKISIISDVNEYIADMRRDDGPQYQYPNDHCRDLFTNLVMVSIIGPKYERSIDRDSDYLHRYKLNDEEDAVGFLTVDSKRFTFDVENDIGILEELAAEAYSAMQQFEFFRTAPFTSLIEQQGSQSGR